MTLTHQQFDELRESISDHTAAIKSTAWAICPPTAGNDASGGFVASLTEAIMGHTTAMVQIANALEAISETLAERETSI